MRLIFLIFILTIVGSCFGQLRPNRNDHYNSSDEKKVNFTLHSYAPGHFLACVDVDPNFVFVNVGYCANINNTISYDDDGGFHGNFTHFKNNHWCIHSNVVVKLHDTLYFYLKYRTKNNDVYYSQMYILKRGEQQKILVTEETKPNVTTTLFSKTPENNEQMSEYNKCPKSNASVNAMIEQLKLRADYISELLAENKKLKTESELYKNLYDGLFETFRNGTVKSSNNLVLLGKNLLDEPPIYILNEIIMYILDISGSDYKIVNSNRLSNKEIKFKVRNFSEKLNILARATFKLKYTKFQIVNFDTYEQLNIEY